MLMHAVSRRLKRAASLPATLAFRASNAQPLFGRLEQRYDASLRPYADRPSLQPIEAAVVDGLQQDGVFITSVDGLGLGGTGVIAAGQRLAGLMTQRVAAMQGDLPHHIEAPAADMFTHPAIYRAGLDASLLRIAEAYLRQPVAYDGALLFHTPADGHERGTRQWHLDREDRRMIKIALYLNDVDEDGGPFEVLRHESHRAGTPFSYQALDTAGLEALLQHSLTVSDTVACTGRTGTLVFADTARFYHRGRPATARPRSAVFFSYFARLPRHPFFCARSRLSRTNIHQLSEGLSPEQQSAARWRDSLPLAARLVPPSMV